MNFEKLKVLIIDDSELCRDELRSALNKINIFEISEGVNGQDGLRKLNLSVDCAGPYDLIIVDLNMPKMDGMTFLQKVKKQRDTRKIPVIVSSLNQEKEAIVMAVKYGAGNYIMKPYDSLTVQLKVQDLLSRRPAS